MVGTMAILAVLWQCGCCSLMQPHFLGGSMGGPVTNPSFAVRGFFGDWQQSGALGQGTFVPQSHNVSLAELASQLADVFSLLVSWHDLFRTVPLSQRQLQELRILDDEFHEAAKAVLSFKATWKKHQMEEAPESRRDLGDQISAQMSESAHKLTRLLYQLCSNRSLASFSAQLAKARNRVVAAQLLRRQYHAGLTPSVDEPAPPPASISRDTRLVKPAHKWTLDLIVDLRQRRVTSLLSSCGLAQQKEQMLLQEQGYAHLFWCLLNYLEDSLGVPVEENGRHWPLTTLCVHPSIAVGQTGCASTALCGASCA
jgi:hypothetical protein